MWATFTQDIKRISLALNTAGIKHDEVTFKEFALGCARAFGYLYALRDDPMNFEIPEFKPDPHIIQSLQIAKEALEKLQKMSLNEATTRALEEYENQVKLHRECKEEKEELRKKYTSMLSRVKSWKPPTKDHNCLQEFMESQLKESIEHDCRDYCTSTPILLTGTEWFEQSIHSAEEDIKYWSKKYADDVERCAINNKWVRELMESLK